MKITASQLRRIIKEEVSRYVSAEPEDADYGSEEVGCPACGAPPGVPCPEDCPAVAGDEPELLPPSI